MTNYYVKEEIVNQIISLYKNKNINNISRSKKIMTNNNKTTMEETDVWVSRTKSGKGFIIAMDKGTSPGTVYVGSITNLEKMVKGIHKGVKLSKFVNE